MYLIHEKTNPLVYLKLNKNILKGILWGAAIGGSIFLFNVLASYLMIGKVLFNGRISEELWIKAILLVGLSEEVLFRGFILQKVSNIFGFWTGNLVSAFLFLLIHIPGWIMTNNMQSPMNMITLVLLGLIFGFVLKKSNSLWGSMVAHSINNYTSLAIYF
jgi:membrane protease YdiL (CAAX protease family)